MPADWGGLTWLAYLVTYVIHSTLLLALALAVTRRLDPRALRLRERIWKAAVLGGLLTALVQVGLDIRPPLGSVTLRASAPRAATAEAEAPLFAAGSIFTGSTRSRPGPVGPQPASEAARTPALALVGLELARLSLASLANELRLATAAEALELAPAAAGASPRVDALVSPAWSRAALVGWSLSGLVCAFLFALGWRRLARELAGRVPCTEGRAHDCLERLRLRAGVRRPVRLFVAPRLLAPLSMGWWRPTICIPPRVERELPDDELQGMLAHELAHLVRRDPPWLFLLWLCETVLFFQPLNRRARRELADTFELSADAWAVGQTGERLALASCLARIAGWVVGAPAPRVDRAWSAAMADALDRPRSRSRLGARIEHLLDEGGVREGARPARVEGPALFAVLSVAALVVPGATAAAPLGPGTPADRRTTLERLVDHARALELDDASGGRPAASRSGALPAEPDEASDPASELLADFDDDLDGLEAEIAALEAELAASEAGADYAEVLADLRRRAGGMRARRERIQALLEVALDAEARLAGLPATDDDSEDSEKGRGE